MRQMKALAVALLLAVTFVFPARLLASPTCSISVTTGSGQWDFACNCAYFDAVAHIDVAPGNSYTGVDAQTSWSNGGSNSWSTTGELITTDGARYYTFGGGNSVTLSAQTEFGGTCSMTAYF